MHAEIRRIDLTTDPATFEMWPSLDWLSHEPEVPTGPRGRGGLWDAMAQAVQRAREASVDVETGAGDADVIPLATDTPHLAYLARVAGGSRSGCDDGRPAEVISLDDLRPRDRY
jgi:hypothetical protein